MICMDEQQLIQLLNNSLSSASRVQVVFNCPREIRRKIRHLHVQLFNQQNSFSNNSCLKWTRRRVAQRSMDQVHHTDLLGSVGTVAKARKKTQAHTHKQLYTTIITQQLNSEYTLNTQISCDCVMLHGLVKKIYRINFNHETETSQRNTSEISLLHWVTNEEKHPHTEVAAGGTNRSRISSSQQQDEASDRGKSLTFCSECLWSSASSSSSSSWYTFVWILFLAHSLSVKPLQYIHTIAISDHKNLHSILFLTRQEAKY